MDAHSFLFFRWHKETNWNKLKAFKKNKPTVSVMLVLGSGWELLRKGGGAYTSQRKGRSAVEETL